MRTQVRGVNVSVTPTAGERPGTIARLSVGGHHLTAGVEWLDAGHLDDLIGLLQRCKHGRASE